MPGHQETTTTRISKSVLDQVKPIAKELGMDISKVVDLCVQDCLSSYKKGKPFVPTIAKLRRLMKVK